LRRKKARVRRAFKNQQKNAAIYFAGAFLAGFLLFFGLEVALFMVSHFECGCLIG
jgi:hypothetical protein